MQPILKKLTDNDLFLASYLQNKTQIIVTFITNEYINMALNWFKWLKKVDLEAYTLVCCLDSETYNKIQQFNIPCIYIDEQDTYKTFNSLNGSDFYKLPRHICIALTLQYLIKKYNINIIYTDVDMIVLKNFIHKIQDELNTGVDTLVYTNKTYSELTLGVNYGISAKDGGGMMLYWNNKTIDLLFEGVKNFSGINADSPKEWGIGSLVKIFKFKSIFLNVFEFTNVDMWKRNHIRKFLKKTSFIIHYNMFDDVTKLSSNEIKNTINKKIECMKKYEHWLL